MNDSFICLSILEFSHRIVRGHLEGLVTKGLGTFYEPNARHWLKIKKDHLVGLSMADTADLVVLGGYYGRGAKGGTVSTFLMGCKDPRDGIYKTVCKVGNGFDDAQLAKYVLHLFHYL